VYEHFVINPRAITHECHTSTAVDDFCEIVQIYKSTLAKITPVFFNIAANYMCMQHLLLFGSPAVLSVSPCHQSLAVAPPDQQCSVEQHSSGPGFTKTLPFIKINSG